MLTGTACTAKVFKEIPIQAAHGKKVMRLQHEKIINFFKRRKKIFIKKIFSTLLDIKLKGNRNLFHHKSLKNSRNQKQLDFFLLQKDDLVRPKYSGTGCTFTSVCPQK